MNDILIHVLYALSGVSAYAALHHALIARRRTIGPMHLWFAVMCAAIAAYVVAKTGAYAADTAELLVQRRRWELSFAIVVFMLFPWFAREYTGQRSIWLPLALSLGMGAVLMANLMLPYGVGFTRLPEFARLTLPWGEQVADLRVPPYQQGPWYQFGRLGMLLVFIYSLHAAWWQYRRGEKRRALALSLAIAVFLTFFLFNQLVNHGVIEFTHTAEFGFLSLVLLMSGAMFHEFRETELRMQAVLDNVPAVVYVKDLQGRYLLVNRRFSELFGIGNGNVTGKTDHELFPAHQAETLHNNDRRVVQERRTLQFEDIVDIDGDSRRLLTFKFPIMTIDGVPCAVSGVSTDVTETREREQEMDILRQQVLHADRVARIGALSTSLAHELSQPLTAILSNAQAGLRFLEQGSLATDESRAILQDIVRDDERAIAIIRGLRAMLRQKSSARQHIGLAQAVTEALDLVDDEIRRRGVRCERALDRDCTVLAEKVQIEQVVLNLVMNALDALDDLPAHERRLHVSLAADGDTQVRVTVRDSGAGLPPDQTERIFESFFSTKDHGLGMGLALCRSIVESHGGRIWAHNNTDRGATVQFILPVAGGQHA